MTQPSLFETNIPPVTTTVTPPVEPVAEAPVTPVSPEKTDDQRILPEPGQPVTLTDGSQVVVREFKLREFLRFLRILTRGGAQALDGAAFSAGMSQDQFIQQLLAMTLFAIPEAEEEVVEFLVSICEPYPLSKDKDEALRQFADLRYKLGNPELDDTITIIEIMVRNEASDIQSLGKRLMSMFKVAGKMGQVKNLVVGDAPTNGPLT